VRPSLDQRPSSLKPPLPHPPLSERT
jgi:hypothetical protein